MKKPAPKSYALRIEPQLVKPLQELKKHNRRSLNAEINAALETWIARSRSADAAPEDAASPPPAPATVGGAKAKRKPARKQPGVPASTPDAPPADL